GKVSYICKVSLAKSKTSSISQTFNLITILLVTSTTAAMAQALNAIYKLAIPAAVGISLFQASIYDVKGGTRAVIFDRLSGVKEQVVNEGTHFLIPWLQKSIIYDV